MGKKRVVRKTKKKEQNTRYYDYMLLAVVIFLLCFGLVMLYSTTAYTAQIEEGDSMWYFKRQAFFSAISVVVMIAVSKIDYHYYVKLSKFAYWFAFALMALVLTPLGLERYGARRWIVVPVVGQMQPAEVMKIAIVLFIPFMICKAGERINKVRGWGVILAWGVISFLGVFILTDNLSTAIIVFGMVCFMLFIAHRKTWPFILIAAAGVGGAYAFARFLGNMMSTSENFRLRRILVWLHPENYSDAGGFQVMQGLYAIGSGGFFGKGLGNSAQKMIIPEVQNDMILSIICEELGVCGAIMVLVLFGMLLYRLMFIARNAPDMYGALLVTGVFAHIAIQVVLNVAVVLNLIPTTGVTLPFISYGGSSVAFLLLEIGLALSVSTKIETADKKM